MIVKKTRILQGFPDFETVKNLSFSGARKDEFCPVFYDIETTGLSRKTTFLYLVGAVGFQDGSWQLCQWMGENEQEEPQLLEAFSQYLQAASCTLQYNGDHFDQPYLEERCSHHGLPSPFGKKPSLDLYLRLKPLKSLLKLSRMKQPDLEAFLGGRGRSFCDGRECIRLYRSYLKNRDQETASIVLGHNKEDLLGLGRIFSMLSYLCLFGTELEIKSCSYNGTQLLLELALPQELPVLISNGNHDFYITAQKQEARLAVRADGGRLRQYYKNYRDYDYLPGEDMAIPKSLSACMDKTLRVPARPETCYTWFDCTKGFLENPSQQRQYLTHTLPYLLSTLQQPRTA